MNEHTKLRITKPCPDCGEPLVIRHNRATSEDFLGCSQWPTCTHTEPLTTYLEMRGAGAPTLPGME